MNGDSFSFHSTFFPSKSHAQPFLYVLFDETQLASN